VSRHLIQLRGCGEFLLRREGDTFATVQLEMKQDLVVFPDRARADAYVREQLKRQTVVDASGVFTWSEFLTVAARPSSALASSLEMRWHLAAAARTHLVGVFGNSILRAAGLSSVNALWTELFLQAITAEQLRQIGSKVVEEVTAKKLKGLADAWDDFDTRLARQHLIDARWVPFLAAEAIARGRGFDWARLSRISFRHFHHIRQSHLSVLDAVARRSHDLGIGFEFEWPSTHDAYADLFVVHALRELEGRWAELNVELVSSESNVRSQPALFVLDSPDAEAAFVAREVKKRLRQNVLPHDIAIVSRDVTADKGRFWAAFADQGISLDCHIAGQLSDTVCGRHIIRLLRLGERDFEVDSLAFVLENAFGSEAPFRSILLQAGCRDSKRGATQKQNGHSARLDQLLRKLPALSGEIRLVKMRVEELFADVTGLPLSAPMTVFAERIASLVAKYQGAPDASLKKWLGFLRAQARETSVPFLLTEALELCEALLAQVETPKAAPGHPNVMLLPSRAMVGRSFQTVFGVGFDERQGVSLHASGLLSLANQKHINECAARNVFRLGVGDGENALAPDIAEANFLFAQLLNVPEVILTRARASHSGQALWPSPRWTNAMSVFSVAEIAIPLRVPLNELESERELCVAATLEALSPVHTRQTARDFRADEWRETLKSQPFFEDAQQIGLIEIERLRFFSDETIQPGRFSGAVRNVEFDFLAFDAARPLSAAEFSLWRQCAAQAFYRRGLQIQSLEPLDEDLDAGTQGVLWHEVMARVLPEIQQLQGTPTRAQVDALVLSAVTQTARSMARTHALGHRLLWALSQRRALKVVSRFLTGDSVFPFSQAAPRALEFAFGTTTSALPQFQVPAALEGERPLYFRGRIDRIDVGPNWVGVIDYKTRVSNELEKRHLKTDIQLPLYLLVAREQFGRADAARWVSLKNSDTRSMPDSDLNSLLATDAAGRLHAQHHELPNLANVLHNTVNFLRQGSFGARPQSCQFCDLQPICRISDRTLDDDS
jgi:hypothetical protein